jgi:hypothetical protein
VKPPIAYQYQVEQWEDEKGMDPFSHQNNLIQDSEGNEENGYPVQDSNNTKIKQCQGTQGCPQEQPQRRNPASNH